MKQETQSRKERKPKPTKSQIKTKKEDTPKPEPEPVPEVIEEKILPMQTRKDENHNAIDMRKEDAELEKILREYNNEVREKPKSINTIIDRPLDLTYIQNVQMPEHLKWITVYSKASESVLL